MIEKIDWRLGIGRLGRDKKMASISTIASRVPSPTVQEERIIEALLPRLRSLLEAMSHDIVARIVSGKPREGTVPLLSEIPDAILDKSVIAVGVSTKGLEGSRLVETSQQEDKGLDKALEKLKKAKA